VARDSRSQRNRNPSLFRVTGSVAENMSAVRRVSGSKLCVLPIVRNANAANVSQLRPWSGARMVELPALRGEIAVTSSTDCLVAIAGWNQC
jgi:hypothetical protein